MVIGANIPKTRNWHFDVLYYFHIFCHSCLGNFSPNSVNLVLAGTETPTNIIVVSCGLWVVGCGLWVVGCGLCCGLASAVSYDTHFVDHPGKQTPPKMMVMKWTPRDFKHRWCFLIHRGSITRAQQGVEGSGRPSFWGGEISIFSTLVSVE